MDPTSTMHISALKQVRRRRRRRRRCRKSLANFHWKNQQNGEKKTDTQIHPSNRPSLCAVRATRKNEKVPKLLKNDSENIFLIPFFRSSLWALSEVWVSKTNLLISPYLSLHESPHFSIHPQLETLLSLFMPIKCEAFVMPIVDS